jgi:hypothetical protein
MNVVSELGTHRVIIMLNSDLYDGIPAVSGKGESLLIYNYPNPFTGSTVIHYQMPERTNVKLEILNMLGKEITTIMHSEQAAGAYNVTFNAGDIPSGIYYLEITTDKETVTKKMLLIR